MFLCQQLAAAPSPEPGEDALGEYRCGSEEGGQGPAGFGAPGQERGRRGDSGGQRRAGPLGSCHGKRGQTGFGGLEWPGLGEVLQLVEEKRRPERWSSGSGMNQRTGLEGGAGEEF